MEPWILDKIKRQEQAKEQERRVQPQLPAPEPHEPVQPREQKPDRGSTIVDFEIKFWDKIGSSCIIYGFAFKARHERLTIQVEVEKQSKAG